VRDLEMAVYATAALVTGPWLFAGGFRDLRTRRLIQNTPTARIRSMAMGLVEINGKVRQRSAVNAPFSGRPCAYWQIEIAVRGRRNSWSTVHRNSSGQPFYVEDETGIAMIYPHGAECRVNFGVEEVCHGLSLPECYAQYMSEQGLAMRHLWRLSSLRFRERLIEESQLVYVLGTGTDGLRADRIRSLQQHVAAVVRRGDNERTFIISQQSERLLTFELGLKAAAKLWGGPLLAIFGLGYWLYALASGHLRL
jgi:hypothetical protein